MNRKLALAGLALVLVAAIPGANVLIQTGAGARIRAALVSNGVVYGDSSAGAASTAALTDGQLIVGQSNAPPAPRTVSGVLAIDNTGATTFAGDAGFPGNVAVAGSVMFAGSGQNWGTCTLNGSSPSTCTGTVAAAMTHCSCGYETGSSVAAPVCYPDAGTLQVTGPNSATNKVEAFCR